MVAIKGQVLANPEHARSFRASEVRLLFGDCIERMRDLPEGVADVMITDPPYCSCGYTEAEKSAAKKQGVEANSLSAEDWFDGDNMTTLGLVSLLRSVFVEAKRILKPGFHMLVFADWRMVPHLAPVLESVGVRYRNLIVWDKGSPGLGNGFRPRHEMIMHFTDKDPQYYSPKGANVISVGRVPGRQKIHPTEKPIELLAKLLEVVTKSGDTVLDPFCGSAYMAEACIKLRRNFVGIEYGRTFFERATKRVENLYSAQQCELRLDA